MQSAEYWQKRFAAMEDAQYSKSTDYIKDMERQFQRTQISIQADIEKWYYRLAENNEITYTAAKKLLSGKELKEFKWSVEDYIKYGKENGINQKWMKELENASAKVHISRLEAMKLQTQQETEKLYHEYNGGVTDFLNKSYADIFYHTAYEVAKGIEVGTNLAKLDTRAVETIITKPWAQDGANFSDRIWSSKDKMINTLHTELTQSIIRGEHPSKAAKAVSKKLGVGLHQAKTLVYTESAAIASVAKKDCLKELDVERYEVVATLDNRTSNICQALDGKVFDMKDYSVGSTAPPFHPNCRSTTCPYFNDEFTKDEKRVARDEDGNNYHVPGDMKYPEWKKTFVDGNPDEKLKFKKNQNAKDDKQQYKKYKKKLGKGFVPEDVDAFQNIKYTDEKEYNILKAQYNGMRYYEDAVSNEPLITSTVKSVAKQNKCDVLGLKYRLKTKDSYLGKIRRDYSDGKTGFEINDIIRYTYGANVDTLVEKTLGSIESLSDMGYNTVKVKNSWLDAKNPYNGINTTVQAPNGQKFEIQYHTQESFDLKNGEMHELYEKQRVISDKKSEEYLELQDEMFALSDKLKVPDRISEVKKYGS